MSLILYVEDDAVLQVDGEMALKSAGYDVVLAADGAEGCAAIRKHGMRLSVLMTDIRLAGPVDGWEVAELGRSINERLPVLYMTGSESEEFAARGVAQGVLVSKPFAWPDVIRSVGALLSQAPGLALSDGAP
jgi:DNA-binding response OmpR family regulator